MQTALTESKCSKWKVGLFMWPIKLFIYNSLNIRYLMNYLQLLYEYSCLTDCADSPDRDPGCWRYLSDSKSFHDGWPAKWAHWAAGEDCAGKFRFQWSQVRSLWKQSTVKGLKNQNVPEGFNYKSPANFKIPIIHFNVFCLYLFLLNNDSWIK